ncbi:hypothetical protein ACRAWD_06665 [Caulobacter segnis]
MLVTAVSRIAFSQALGMIRRGGTVSPERPAAPGDFPLAIFDTVLRGITVRGSIVGTRLDLAEALGLRRRRPGQGHHRDRPPGRGQHGVRPHGEGPDQRPRVLDFEAGA